MYGNQETVGLINNDDRSTSIIWSPKYKYMILYFIAWLTFGSYWVYDTPGAIQTQLTEWFGGNTSYTPAMNQALYYVYSFPNVILAFFGGYIVDKITGIRLGAILFCGFIVTGDLIFSIGIQTKVYAVCVFGRFVFGLGGESLTVAQNAYTARWFTGKEMAFAFGLVVAFSRIGTSINFLITPYFAKIGVPFSIWFGAEMCMISFCAALYCALLDWHGDEAAKHIRSKSGGDNSEPDVQCSHIFQFPLMSWLVFLNCAFFYAAIFTFYQFASVFFQSTGSNPPAPEIASDYVAIPNLIAIVVSPLMGATIDKYGRSIVWILVSSSLLAIALLMCLARALAWDKVGDIPIAVIMTVTGFAYSIFASAIWPMLPFIIKRDMLGTGFGMMTSIQNLFLVIVPVIVSQIQSIQKLIDTDYQYVAILGISVVFTIVIYVIDKATTNAVLNDIGDVKERYQNEVLNARTKPTLTVNGDGPSGLMGDD